MPDRLAPAPGLVRRLIASQFPHWAGLPLRPAPAQGWDNATFRLGSSLKVRLPTAARYAAQVGKEARVLPSLAPHLPLPIPAPVALGVPGEGYPFAWSVQRWLPGRPAAATPPAARAALAPTLAVFLRALQAARPEGPPPGPHSFFRGGPLDVYAAQAQAGLAAPGPPIDAAGARAVWEAARAALPPGPPVWVHGDIAPGNLLVARGRLVGVIDFGACAVGDPSCDLAIAWTFFEGAGRERFRAAVAADAATWARARGWALWKALLDRAERRPPRPGEAPPEQVIAALVAERAAASP